MFYRVPQISWMHCSCICMNCSCWCYSLVFILGNSFKNAMVNWTRTLSNFVRAFFRLCFGKLKQMCAWQKTCFFCYYCHAQREANTNFLISIRISINYSLTCTQTSKLASTRHLLQPIFGKKYDENRTFAWQFIIIAAIESMHISGFSLWGCERAWECAFGTFELPSNHI